MLDASVLVALVDLRHPRHAEAQKSLQKGTVTIHWGSLAELTTVVRRLAKDEGLDGSAVARAAIRRIQSLEGFREPPAVSLTEVTRLYEAEPSLSFVDAWTLVVALQTGLPLLSYDAGLVAAHRRRLRR